VCQHFGIGNGLAGCKPKTGPDELADELGFTLARFPTFAIGVAVYHEFSAAEDCGEFILGT